MTPVAITKVQLKRIPSPDGERVQLKARINGEKFKLSFKTNVLDFSDTDAAFAQRLYDVAIGMELICRWREAFPDMPRDQLGLHRKNLPPEVTPPKDGDWSFIRHEFRSIKNFV